MSDEAKIKNIAIRLFVKNGADMTKSHTQAALITAVSKMALVHSGEYKDKTGFIQLASKEETEEVMSTIYSSPETLALVEMAPQYVKPAIGFAVDFNDYNSAKSGYDSMNGQHEMDGLYADIKVYHKKLEQSKKQEPSHTMQ